MIGTPRPATVFTKQQRIAELARNGPEMAFTTLAHHIDINWMHMAYAQTRKDGAVGVDGQTAADYENNLMGNLQDLLDRAKSGTYVAPPVRRVHIPKAGSPNETRPLGIPTFEDKILQRAVLMVLEPVYETDFLDASHGFRPGRGAHGALDSLWKQTMNLGCCWIVDVDLRKFFDTIDHGHLREFLKRRVRDGVILRLIGKWLNAGVLEDGVHTTPEHGTPQGGVISPLLANIVLHYVLDEWFAKEVRPRLTGEAFLIRYADDFVIGVAREDDARRIMEVLPKRMSKYGLTVHPEKTRRGPVPSGRRGRLRTRGPELHWPPDIRLLGLHPLLGTKPTRRMGGQVQDGEGPTQASAGLRCRRGAGRTCTCRLEINTRSSRKSWKAITVTMGSSVTMPASRSFWGPPAGSGNDGCRGVAGTNRCRGRSSCGWSSITVFPRPVWSTAC